MATETKDLKRVPLMEATVANGIEFAMDDLRSVAASFEALDLAGRVPLKMGHEGPDVRDDPTTQFALGWVSRVWVEGDRLMANFSGIPERVYNWIKAGMLKFVSVELLKNVKAGNRRLPWVLDAVALLGSDQPAFGNLGDLQSLTMSRSPQLQAESRFVFSLSPTGGKPKMSDETELTKLTRELIQTIFNHAIETGRILPRDRVAFERRYSEAGTAELAREWIASAPKPHGFSSGMQSRGGTSANFDQADDELNFRAKELIEQRLKEGGQRLTFVDASFEVLRTNKALADRYKQFTIKAMDGDRK